MSRSNPHYMCGTVHSPRCPTGEHAVPVGVCLWVQGGEQCPTGEHADITETILSNIAADRGLARSSIGNPEWSYWIAGTYAGTPTHVGAVDVTYTPGGYYRAVYGFDIQGNVSCYAD